MKKTPNIQSTTSQKSPSTGAAGGNFYTNKQLIALTLLRVMIGWHFLYEGLVKIYTPGWTAAGYLSESIGPLAPLFRSLAQNETLLHVTDLMNEWGLVLIGLSLFIGFFSKPAKILGIVLLALYYLAYPPFANLRTNTQVEGSYWIVNKNLIEIGALLVLFLFPSSQITGIDRFLLKLKNRNLIIRNDESFNDNKPIRTEYN